MLIDEYDKPILDHISDIETAEANRQVLRGFYSILKSMDPHLEFMNDGRFMSYWYSSGTPWFLIDMIKSKPESFLALRNLEIREMVLDTFDIQRIEVEPLLFQTGYLTVKEVIQTKGSPIYVLDLPNYEVRDAFNLQIVSALTESGDVKTERVEKSLQ